MHATSFRVMKKAWPATALMVCSLVLSACAVRQPGDPISPGYNVYTPEQDVQIGKEASAEIRKQVEVVDNPQLQDYISDLGKKLSSPPEAKEYPYSFTLINDENINAFALPGGPIFVHSGLLQAADTEGQLVGVLAHEISHVALRHGTSQATKASMVQLPAVLAGAAIGQDSVLGQLGQIGLGLGVNSLMMRYSRGAERQSDLLGTRLMAESGYNPIEMARFFEKLQSKSGGSPGILRFLSSHPDPGNRAASVEEEIAALPARKHTADSGQFRRMKSLVARLPKPRKPQKAPEEVASAPSDPSPSSFRQLAGRRFSMEYPAGWRAYGNQSSAVMTIAPPNGLVRSQSGGVAIGYGAVVSYYAPSSRNATLQTATRELIAQLQEMNRSLRIDDRAFGVRVAGSRGLRVTLLGDSPYGGTERNLLVTVARPEGLFYVVFVAPDRQFTQVQQGTFQRMIQSIRFQR